MALPDFSKWERVGGKRSAEGAHHNEGLSFTGGIVVTHSAPLYALDPGAHCRALLGSRDNVPLGVKGGTPEVLGYL